MFMNHLRQVSALLLTMTLLTITACSAVPNPIEGEPTEGDEVPAIGGEISYGMTGEPVILNPILATDSPSAWVNNRVYAGLVRADENLQMQPYIAEDWEYSEDGLEWTFFLRDDVYFHDGEQLTSADVAYTFEAILHPEYTGARASLYQAIDEVQTPDEYTVRFILSEPFAPLLSNLTVGILPSHLFRDTPIAQMRELDVNLEPVGSGPYTLQEWESGQYIILQANRDFFLEGPYIEQVTVRMYGDEQVMLASLEAGEIDLLGSIPPDDVDRMMDEYPDQFTFHHLQDNGYSYIGLKQTDPILQDVRVRQALMLGIDRQGMVDNLLNGQGTVMHANIPPFSWAYNEDLNAYEHNPDAAIELLQEAGWTNVGPDGIRRNAAGERLQIQVVTSTGNRLREDTLLIAQQELIDIGVDLQPDFYEWSVLLNQYLDVAQFQAYMLGWSLGLDPDCYIYFHSSEAVNEDGNLVGYNDVEYSNSEVDELLERGRSTFDEAERAEIYGEIQKTLNEELPYLFLFSRDIVAAVSRDIRGMTMSNIGALYPEQWYVETEPAE